MTLSDFISDLEASGVPDAEFDLLTMAERASGLPYSHLIFMKNDSIDGFDWLPALDSMVKRRKCREPLQYILGEWEFFGDRYKVSPACLIPRADTELSVSLALDGLCHHARVADLCCGSGCIGIAVALHSDASVDSFDISREALSVAKSNADALGISDRVNIAYGDVLEPELLSGEYDLIISNPPYIKTDVIDSLSPELSYEPRIALDGGCDGMTFYRSILSNFKNNLTSGGRIIFEIGYDQSEMISSLAEAHGFNIEIHNDLGGNARAAVLTLR